MNATKRLAAAALMLCVAFLLWQEISTKARRRGSNTARPTAQAGSPLEAAALNPVVGGDDGRETIGQDAQGNVVTGCVRDAQTHLPVRQALVSVLGATGNNVDSWTDEKGNYRLSYLGSMGVLRGAAPGYKTVAVDLNAELIDTYDLELVPSRQTEVFVVWKDGTSVPGARIVLSKRMPVAVDDEASDGNWAFVLGESDSNGRLSVMLSEPSYLAALEGNSGCFSSSLAVPGTECVIVLSPKGAQLVFVPDRASTLSGLSYSLSRREAGGGNCTMHLSGGGSRLQLQPGTWMLRIEGGPFALDEVFRDGQTIENTSNNTVAFAILDSTDEIAVRLTSGLGIRLMSSGKPVEGRFTYRLRQQWGDGMWRDAHLYQGRTDRNGDGELYPIFSDPLASLRIDAPGYRPEVISAGILAASLHDSTRVEIDLVPAALTYFRLQYENGTPYSGLVMVDAAENGSLRELFVGRCDAAGEIPPLVVMESEDVRFANWDRVTLASVAAPQVRIGEETLVVVDGSPGRLVILGAPSQAPILAIVGAKGDRHYFSRLGGRLTSPPLPAGKYFVGPPEIADACRLFSGGFGATVSSSGKRVLQVYLEQGQDLSIPYNPDWVSGETRGRVTVVGPVGELFAVPVYPNEGIPVALGPSMPMIRLDADGTYQIPSDICAPDLVAICSVDAFGYPIPLDFVPPGGNAVVKACSIRLEWSDATTDLETGFVSFAIASSGFSMPVTLTSNEFAAVWQLGEPLEITGLPCGSTRVLVRVGARVESEEASASFGSCSVVYF